MTESQSPDTSGTRSRQAGISLIEVLIAVFVLAFGILGIAAMQAGALRNNQGAYEQSTAVFLTYSILDAMRASMKPAASNPGILAVRPGYVTNNFVCQNSQIPTTDALAANDLARWLQSIRDNLNGGVADNNACGSIVCGEGGDLNLCTVSIQWNNSRSLGGNQQQVVSTRSRL